MREALGRIIPPALVALLLTLALSAPNALAAPPVYRIDHVTDGDTVVLRNDQRVRLVQIDTPEIFFGAECYGRGDVEADEGAASLWHSGTNPAGACD